MRRLHEGALDVKGAIRTTRLRWFTGRFITARDLTDEQEYHLERNRLHNRLMHGWGVVCGLQVHPHDREDCAHEWVWVDPGIAIDCRGREVVLPCREAVQWVVDPERTSDADALAVLCLRYDECLTEPVPAIVGGCQSGTGTATELSRVVERWRLEVHPIGDSLDDPDDRWAALLRGDAQRCGPGCRCPGRSGHDCGCGSSGSGCLEPLCPLGDCVPIALLSRCRRAPIDVDAERDGLRPAVRRSMPPPAAYLTHVVSTSWTHGRDLSIDDLDERGGELRVTFDRALSDGDQDRVGINPHTFLVEIEDSTGARERLPFDPERPPRVEDGCHAVFTMHPDVLSGSGRRGGTRSLVGDAVFVTLLGDLVHDCHGLPVDADFFGTFPSGDGVRGGVLRSWFFVSGRKGAGA